MNGDPSQNDNPADLGFCRRHRLLSAEQFAEVFAARRVLRGQRFTLHFRPTAGEPPRLGLVIPKKQAKTAVLRNAVKRQVREIFRHRLSGLPALDLVLRLAQPLGKADDKTARASWRAEIDALFDQVRTKVPPRNP